MHFNQQGFTMKRFQTTAVFITMMALSFFFAGCNNSGSDHGLKNQPPVSIFSLSDRGRMVTRKISNEEIAL
jgi:hypothetical protein